MALREFAAGLTLAVAACGPTPKPSPDVVVTPSAEQLCSYTGIVEPLPKGGPDGISAKVYPPEGYSCVYGAAGKMQEIRLGAGALVILSCVDEKSGQLTAEAFESAGGPFHLSPVNPKALSGQVPPCEY